MTRPPTRLLSEIRALTVLSSTCPAYAKPTLTLGALNLITSRRTKETSRMYNGTQASKLSITLSRWGRTKQNGRRKREPLRSSMAAIKLITKPQLSRTLSSMTLNKLQPLRSNEKLTEETYDPFIFNLVQTTKLSSHWSKLIQIPLYQRGASTFQSPASRFLTRELRLVFKELSDSRAVTSGVTGCTRSLARSWATLRDIMLP